MNKTQLLKNWIKQDWVCLTRNLIVPGDRGYDLFGWYRVTTADNGFAVFYGTTQMSHFSSARAAVSWCIAHKYGRYEIATKLVETDQALSRLDNDIAAGSARLKSSTNAEFYDKVQVKLDHKIRLRGQMEIQLTKWVRWAKYQQQQGFKHETARTR
jgi:hypothetical protein